MKQHKVYLITNIVNDKKYVGMTGRPLKFRFQHHVYDSNAGSTNYLHYAIRKYGEDNFKIKLLESFETREESLDAEVRYIKQFGTYLGEGYNMTPGGEGVRAFKGEDNHFAKITSKTAAKISWLLQHTDMTQYQIADEFEQVTRAIVSFISTGRAWNHIKPIKPQDKHIKDRKGIAKTLSTTKAEQVKHLALDGNFSQRNIGKVFGVSQSTVSQIKRGEYYANVKPVKPPEEIIQDLDAVQVSKQREREMKN